MKIWKIAVVVTLAVALVLGVTLPGLAASDETVPQTSNFASNDEPPTWGKKLPRIVSGEVTEIDDESFVIDTMEDPIYVSEGTKYFTVFGPRIVRALHRWRTELGQPGLGAAELPAPAKGRPPFRLPWLKAERAGQESALFRFEKPELAPNLPQPNEGKGKSQGIWANLKQLWHFGEEATFDDIAVGDKVVVWLAPETNGYLAKIVTIIEPTTYARVTGTITDVSDDFITIEPVSGGDEVPLEYNESTTFILKGFTSVEVEQFACAVYNTETMMAKVVRVWPEAPQLPQPAE